MTPKDIIANDLDKTSVDLMLDHSLQQLSTLMDGELAPDEARFLLRRLQHDDELRGCWERWQLCGDVLRGQVDAVLPRGFAGAVAAAVASEHIAGAGGSRWLRLGGGAALAASAAVIALMLARHAPDDRASSASPPIAATTPAPGNVAVHTDTVPQRPARPDHIAQIASAVAGADVPRRIAGRRSRAQAQRAAMRPSRASIETPTAAIAIANAAPAGAPVDPFSVQHASVQRVLPSRPWPRALLPGSSASGAFTVDYGGSRGASPSFYPFEPRVQQPVADDTSGDGGPPP